MSPEVHEPEGEQRPGRAESPGSRWAVYLALVGMLVASGWGTGNWLVWQRIGSDEAFPAATGELQIHGIGAPVQIERDARGIPHITAASEADAWTSLGFVHAQDRLAQMLWLRRLARGRTAEVFGELGLAADRQVRTIGIGRLADEQAERLKPQVEAPLKAYAAGVNARIARIQAGLVEPPVGLSAEVELEAWTPADSLAVVKLLAWASAPDPATAVVLETLLEQLGTVGARPFFPTGGGVRGVSLPFAVPTSDRPAVPTRAATNQPRVSLSDVELRISAWSLAAEVTAGGAPLVAVDIHTRPTTPALLYESYLTGGDLHVVGVSVPGAPAFWAGRNRDLAWAASPAQVVTADLYRETLRPPTAPANGPGSFRQGREWKPLQRRVETIWVKQSDGSQREEQLEVLSTRHGPLLGWLQEPLALRWTGAEPGDGVGSLIGVLHARNGRELCAALETHHEPVLAVLYADREGDVGMQMAGWLPRKILATGLLPVPGRKFGFDWREPLRFESLPSRRLRGASAGSVDAASDWLIVADNQLFDSHGGSIEWLWRSGRIAERLDRDIRALVEAGPVEMWAAARLQRGLASSVPRGVIEALLELAGDPRQLGAEAGELHALFESWDGEIRPESAAATAYLVFAKHFLELRFADAVGSELLERYLALNHIRPRALVEAVLEATAGSDRGGGWSDIKVVRAAVREGLIRTSRNLVLEFGLKRSDWNFARALPVSFRSLMPTPRKRLPSRRAPASARAPEPWNSGFLRLVPGSSFEIETVVTGRLLMDLSDSRQLLSVLAPGQSEHPGHAHFEDGLSRWRAGRHGRLVMSPFLVREATVQRLVLSPRR